MNADNPAYSDTGTTPTTQQTLTKPFLEVTEETIEIELRKAREKSPHEDNISATEYFTKGMYVY